MIWCHRHVSFIAMEWSLSIYMSSGMLRPRASRSLIVETVTCGMGFLLKFFPLNCVRFVKNRVNNFRAGNALAAPVVLLISMGENDHLSSRGSSTWILRVNGWRIGRNVANWERLVSSSGLRMANDDD